MKRSSTSKKLLVGGLIALIVFLFVRFGKKNLVTKEAAIRLVFQPTKYAPLIPYIIRLAKVESADFTSSLYERSHNFTSMGVPSSRPYTRSGTTTADGGRAVSVYSSDVQCAEDLLKWFQYWNSKETIDVAEVAESNYTFAKYLKRRNYFPASAESYAKALDSWS